MKDTDTGIDKNIREKGKQTKNSREAKGSEGIILREGLARGWHITKSRQGRVSRKSERKKAE